MIARAPILKNQSRFTRDQALVLAEKEGPFNSHYVAARTNVYHIMYKVFGSDMAWVLLNMCT